MALQLDTTMALEMIGPEGAREEGENVLCRPSNKYKRRILIKRLGYRRVVALWSWCQTQPTDWTVRNLPASRCLSVLVSEASKPARSSHANWALHDGENPPLRARAQFKRAW